MKHLLFVLCLFVPQVLEASVLITEVAWMGGLSSANHEWIELYNTGGQVDLTGWTLNDGANLTIALYGTLGASQYAVLERSSDDSASGAAYIVYSGALVNTGATLTLKDKNGAVIESVAGGDGWQNIGGNNTSKETPQRSQSGWTTGVATPGSGSYQGTASPPAQQPQATTTATTSSPVTSSSGGGGGPVKSIPSQSRVLNLEPRELSVAISAKSSGYVNQPVSFTVVGFGLSPTILKSLEHGWNFGDLGTALGSSVTHTFSTPGKYIVMVESTFKSHTAMARHDIEIRAIPLAMEVDNTSVTLRNNASYEVDISNFALVGEDTVRIPPHSWLQAGAELVIPKRRLGQDTKYIRLYNATNTQVLAHGIEISDQVPVFSIYQAREPFLASTDTNKVPTGALEEDNKSNPIAQFPLWPSNSLVAGLASSTAQLPIADTLLASTGETQSNTNPYIYTGLVLLLLVGISGVLGAR